MIDLLSSAVSYGGMLCILAAFVLETQGRLSSRGSPYLWLMIVGSGLLALRAAHSSEWAFLILETVWDREIPYMDLLYRTGLDKVTLTQQTTIMRRKGILKAERQGGSLVFSVANPKILKAFNLMREVVIGKIRQDTDLLAAVLDE